MRKTATLSARITPALDAKLEKLAKRQGRTKSQIISVAIADFLESEAEYRASIDRGLADIAAGRKFTTEEVVSQMRAGAKARK